MGYQTDYVGYLYVHPPLDDAEIACINAISRTRPVESVDGLELVDEVQAARRELAAGQPRGWSNWEACSEGCCLSYDGGDKANHMVPWLKYLMSTYVVPGAVAEGKPGFEDFTFDHVVNGMVVGSRRDNRELFSITVRENEVEVELLWPGVPEWSDYPQLGYQVAIDRYREWAARYRLEQARKQARERRAEAMRGIGDE